MIFIIVYNVGENYLALLSGIFVHKNGKSRFNMLKNAGLDKSRQVLMYQTMQVIFTCFRPIFCIISFLSVSAILQPLFAQDNVKQAASQPAGWHFRAEPYIMFPNMAGSTGISSFPLAEVEVSSSTIFDNLKMGAMLFLEASNGDWSINSDFLYMNLEKDAKPANLIKSGRINLKQVGWEVAGLKRVNPWLEFGVGGLLNSLKVELNLTRNQAGGEQVTFKGSQSKTWVDPMLITRLTLPGKNNFIGQFRGEVGGFGIGSDFAWQLQATAGYRFSKLFDMTAGYRAIGLDYTSGDDGKAFVYDMVTHGPMIRFGFRF
jgi:hypothetical protein